MNDQFYEEAHTIATVVLHSRSDAEWKHAIKLISKALRNAAANALFEANAVHALAKSGVKKWDPIVEVQRRADKLRLLNRKRLK